MQYLYCLVRKDLDVIQQAIQAAHAAVEVARLGLVGDDCPPPHIVLCGVKDELALLQALSRLDSVGISYKAFREPDLNDELTALCTAPISGALRRHFKRYNLLTLDVRSVEVV